VKKEESLVILRYKPTKMDPTKIFDQLTWDDVVMENGVLKSIRDFPINELKHKDLRTVCSRLKIKGVKNTSIEKIVSVYKLKEPYSRLNEDSEPFLTPTRKEPQCPYRLLNVLFSGVFCEGLAQLGIALTGSNLTPVKQATISYFGKAFKRPLHALLN